LILAPVLNELVYPVFGTVHYQFLRYQAEKKVLLPTVYRAWSDYTDVQIGLVQHWWQRMV
jgi:hypothetical protein